MRNTAEYFFTPQAGLPDGVGFALWDGMHLRWLAIAAALIVLMCLLSHRAGTRGRTRLRVAVGCAILFLELVQDGCLLLQGAFTVWNLPLHLCGLAVFFCFFHSLHPGKTVGNFIYSTCAPGALFALLFPDWTMFPPFSLHSIVAFGIHALIVAYPLVLLAGGMLKPEARTLPRCFGLLLALAAAVYLFNLRWGTNYMFLRWPSEGSPLEWFASLLGEPGYLLGYLPMTAAVWGLLYLPFIRKEKRGSAHRE